MKHSDYIAAEGIAWIDKIRGMPIVFKLYFIVFIFFLLLPFTSLAAVF